MNNIDTLPVTKLRDLTPQTQSVIPTGMTELDDALGIGGIPRGRVIEIYGEADSGKSALALHIARRSYGRALYIDADHHLSKSMLWASDIDPGALYLFHAETLEDALDVCKLAAPAFDVIVIDSLPALPTIAEIRRTNDMLMTYPIRNDTQAAVLSRALPRLMPTLHTTGCTLIVINQLRSKPGVVYETPDYSTGGNALKYYSAVRLETHRREPIREYATCNGGKTIGQRLAVRVVKNKCAAPGRRAEIYWGYERGFVEARGAQVAMALQWAGDVRKNCEEA